MLPHHAIMYHGSEQSTFPRIAYCINTGDRADESLDGRRVAFSLECGCVRETKSGRPRLALVNADVSMGSVGAMHENVGSVGAMRNDQWRGRLVTKREGSWVAARLSRV